MDELTWEKVAEVQGRLDADLIESYLEANGIDVELIQEAIGRSVYPVTVDGLGRVQVFVPKEKVVEARELLKNFDDVTFLE
jgi:fibronectin type 3 domain-containing protein